MKIILSDMMVKRGMDQQELSKRSGVPQPIISNIVTGRTPTPRYDTLFMLARALHCAMEELIQEEKAG